MANITASMVKELREMTGAGMMDCKKALGESDGNMEAAVEILKKSGAAKVEKKKLYNIYYHFASKCDNLYADILQHLCAVV